MVYILILLVIIIAFIVNDYAKLSLKLQRNIERIVLLLIIVLAGVRKNIGFDYDSYYKIFESTSKVKNFMEFYFHDQIIKVEIGFSFLISLLKTLSLDYNFFLLITSFFSLITLYYSIRKYSVNVMLSIGLYYSRFYFLRDMNQIRSALSCSVVLLGISFLEKKEKRKYFFIVLIASLIHKGALIFIVFYLFNNFVETSRIKLFLIFVVAYFLTMLPIEIILNDLLSGVVSNSYLAGGWLNEKTIFFNKVILIGLFQLITYTLLEKKIAPKYDYYYLIRNIYSLALLILILLTNFYVLGSRLSTFLLTVEIFLIPSIALGIKQNKAYNILVLLYIILLFYINVIIRLNNNFYFPYESIFN